MKRLLFALTALFLAAVAKAAVPDDGGVWEIEKDAVDSLASGEYTISQLKVNGSLTLEAGATLTTTGIVVSAVSDAEMTESRLFIESGATLYYQGYDTAETPANTYAFAIGLNGGTGMVHIANGGTLYVQDGELAVGRNGDSANNYNRDVVSFGVLDISGYAFARKLECSAWFPTLEASFYGQYDVENDLAVSCNVNLNEGGVLEIGHIQRNDKARAVFNFRGGTLRAYRDNNDFCGSAGALLWNIDEGKNLVFDTNGHNIRLNQATVQTNFFMIVGSGGFVKTGSGYLQICLSQEANTFTGPIIVEAGIFSLGRPLLEGQTVFVKSGATFYPASAADLDKITYENPDDEPEGGLFVVQTQIQNGLDLLAMAPLYYTDQLGGPAWGWGGSVYGPVTHSEVSVASPFGLVGQGATLTLTGTGLDTLPLYLSGASGAFNFSGNRCIEPGQEDFIRFSSNALTYRQSGTFSIQGTNTAAVLNINNGRLITNEMRVGYDSGDGTLNVTSNSIIDVNGNMIIGGNTGDRYKVSGTVNLENTALNVSGEVRFSPNALTDGSDLNTVLNRLVLGAGSFISLGYRFTRNDDSRSRIVADGGVIKPMRVYDSVAYSGQNGVLEFEATSGNYIDFSIGTNRIGFASSHLHMFGEGGFRLNGSEKFILGANDLTDFVIDYNGDTVLDSGTLRLRHHDLLPHGEGKGKLTGNGGRLDLAGCDVTINGQAGEVYVFNSSADATVNMGELGDMTLSHSTKDNAIVGKIGSGEMTVKAHLSKGITVKEGTVKVVNSEMPRYRSFRLKVDGYKGAEANSMQIAELKLMDGANDITREYDSIGFDSNKGTMDLSYPDNENPNNLVDGNIKTKWLDFRATGTAEDTERVWVRLDYAEPRRITHYAICTANDHPDRDPTAWRLQGSNDDGETWTDLDVQTGYMAPYDRFEWSAPFSLGGGSFGRDSTITVEKGASFVADGGEVAVQSIDNDGTVELRNGATLLSGGGYIRGGVTGDGGVSMVGDGELTICNTNTYTGVTRAERGTINFGSASGVARSYDGKYFRLIIKSTGGTFQLSEFHLYDESGEAQNLNLARAANWLAPSALDAGQFSIGGEYVYTDNDTWHEGPEKMFDNNVDTKFCNNETIGGHPSMFRVISMRLANDANPIVSYNFFTANDHNERSPKDWILQGSRDGLTWDTLDVKNSVQAYPSDANHYKIAFNNGENYTFSNSGAFYSKFYGKYIRVTFMQTCGNTIMQLSELLLYDVNGNRVNAGLQMFINDGVAATAIPAGYFCRGGSYAHGNNEDADRLFDGNTGTKWCATNNDMKGDPANYRVITMHLADNAEPVYAYNFLTANDALGRTPCAWKVEGSLDGVVWETLDQQSGLAQPAAYFTPVSPYGDYHFSGVSENTALASLVQADAGAVVNVNDANMTIPGFRVDLKLGGGTVNDFRAAANGRLEVENFPAGVSLNNYLLPLTVNPVDNKKADLSGWKVSVNGTEIESLRVMLNSENKLFLLYAGTVFILQ